LKLTIRAPISGLPEVGFFMKAMREAAPVFLWGAAAIMVLKREKPSFL
jgi:hypothetical protein